MSWQIDIAVDTLIIASFCELQVQIGQQRPLLLPKTELFWPGCSMKDGPVHGSHEPREQFLIKSRKDTAFLPQCQKHRRWIKDPPTHNWNDRLFLASLAGKNEEIVFLFFFL
jgi:hypothetical protein